MVPKKLMVGSKNTLKRLSFIVLGILSILAGIIFAREGWSSLYRLPVPRFSGYLWIAFGVILLLYGIFTKKIPKEPYEDFVICPECMNSFYAKDVHQNQCPKCEGTVEDLDGFYDRHPELREETKREN